jgi:hypothetical protein
MSAHVAQTTEASKVQKLIKLRTRAEYEHSLSFINEEFTLVACIVAMVMLFQLDASVQPVMLISLCLMGAIYTIRKELERRLNWWTLSIADSNDPEDVRRILRLRAGVITVTLLSNMAGAIVLASAALIIFRLK